MARLNAGLGEGIQVAPTRLILVSAPAGFGKTTLVTSWLAELAAVEFAWLSLDEADSDPVRFLTYLIAALQTAVPGAGEAAAPLLQSPQPAAVEGVLTLLINDISSHGLPIIFVLEDYHLINSLSVHNVLAYLIDNLPPTLRLVLITRSDPPLPLTRLRARGQLLEIRVNELRFSMEEAGLFLSQVMGTTLVDDDLAALELRTEGWIAGLQLAALSIEGLDDPHDFIAAFTGSNRYILDYLTDEVLDKRPKGTKEFLLQTAILNRLCGPLCNAVTGQSDGQATLERLEQANLFLIPLDKERRWYRYHHLFAEVLRQRLQREHTADLPELHRRARLWFEQNGLVHEAIDHALAGLEFEEAIRLIESVTEIMLHTGASASLTKWLDSLPEELVRARPRLCLARGWTYQWGSGLNLQKAEEWSQLALVAAQAGGSLNPGLVGESAALQAMIAATRGEMALSRELAGLALEKLPAESPWRSAIVFSLGTTQFDSGNLAAAAACFEEALRLSQEKGVHYIQLAATSFLADLQVFQGHLGRAAELYDQVLSWALPDIPQKGAVMAQAGLANIQCERNHLDTVLARLQLGMAQLGQVGGAWAAFVLFRVQARLFQASGDLDKAIATMNQMVDLGQSTQVSLVATQAAAFRARLQLAHGDFSAAEAWALVSGLDANDVETDDPGWRETEYITLARVLTTRGDHAGALSLLKRLLQTAREEGRFGSVIAIQILLSLIYREMGDSAAAHVSLEHALALAEPEAYCRIFVDEGEPMLSLLMEFQVRTKRKISTSVDAVSLRHLAYTENLIAAFSESDRAKKSRDDLKITPLSDRELDILKMIAAGLTNQEIADTLMIAVSTVKSHINSLYGKLGTHRRTEAVAIARDLGLLLD